MKSTLVYKKGSLAIAVLLGCMTLTMSVLISLVFQFDVVQNLVMSWILTTLYAVSAFLIVDRKIVEKEFVNEIREVETPVYHVVPEIEKEFIPVDNPIYHIVEKPVEKKVYVEVPVEIEKKIYIEKPRKKLNIPKYKFVGSDETKTYHKRTCRFKGMIKKKNKMSSNSEYYFKRRGFAPCKTCLGKK